MTFEFLTFSFVVYLSFFLYRTSTSPCVLLNKLGSETTNTATLGDSYTKIVN